MTASGMDIVLLKVSVVVPKPFDTETTRPISCSGPSYHFWGHLAPSFEMAFNSSVCFYQTHIDMLYHYDLFSWSPNLTNQQHGFRKKRSCESQLILTLQDLASTMGENEQIGAILLDSSKAFIKFTLCNRGLKNHQQPKSDDCRPLRQRRANAKMAMIYRITYGLIDIPSSFCIIRGKKISNVQELIQSDPTSCPQKQKGNN